MFSSIVAVPVASCSDVLVLRLCGRAGMRVVEEKPQKTKPKLKVKMLIDISGRGCSVHALPFRGGGG